MPTNITLDIPGVPVLKVHIYIFEFQKKMEEKICSLRSHILTARFARSSLRSQE